MTSCLPHAYVISLERQPARRAASIARLEGRLAYTIVDAVDGRAMDEAALRAVTSGLHSARLGRPLSLGEIGCALSHARALAMFLASGAPFGLILEDDFAVRADTFAMLSTVVEMMTGRADVDLVKLGGEGPVTSPGALVAEAGGVSLIATLTHGCLTHAYLVSRAGAARLAAAITPVRAPYDIMLRDAFAHRCRLFETSPWLFALDEDLRRDSAIEPGRARMRRRAPALADRASRAATTLANSLRKHLWNARRFGWRAVFAKSSFRRFPSGAR